jgi:hypothetical protein
MTTHERYDRFDIVATYVRDLCRGMQSYADSEVGWVVKNLPRLVRMAEDEQMLAQIYRDVTGIADVGDHQ